MSLQFDAGRNNNFDAIRFVLATLVIASHSYPLFQGNNSCEPLARLSSGQMTGGELAVNGFFILSGYLILQSWERSRGMANFFRKRALRIYPGFLVAVAFGALVVAPCLATSAAAYWQQLSPVRLVGTTLNLNPRLPAVFSNLPVPAVNGSLWSIRYEVFCYLALAAAGCVGVFRLRWVVLALFCLVMGVFTAQSLSLVKIPGSGLSWLVCDLVHWPRLGACFLSGTLFYLYRNSIAYSPRLFALSLAALLSCFCFPQLKLLSLMFPLFGAYVLFYLAFLPIPRLHAFTRRGDISYGLYLYAFPVQQLLVHRFGNQLTPETLFALAFPITALLAAMSWFIVERPFLKKETKTQANVERNILRQREVSSTTESTGSVVVARQLVL